MLFGPRVILRAFSPDDFETYAEFRNDLELTLLGGLPKPRPRSDMDVRAQLEQRMSAEDPGTVFFAIETDARLIGELSFRDMDVESRTWELGISIGDRRYWSRAYGREAINVALDYAFRVRNIHKVFLTTDGTNERAIRSYRACGFVEEGRLRQHKWRSGGYEDQVQMGILRSEWLERHGDGVPDGIA